ncbi:MAG: hypothetical protein O3C60_08015, partial [Planctomycetota bacterium]|nr:hypothetical protein [Planctomycetota bacterium]
CLSRPWMTPQAVTPLAVQTANPGGNRSAATKATPRLATDGPQPPSTRQTPETKAVVSHGTEESLAGIETQLPETQVPETASHGPSTESLHSMVAMLNNETRPTTTGSEPIPGRSSTVLPTVPQQPEKPAAKPRETRKAKLAASVAPSQTSTSAEDVDMIQFRDDESDRLPIPPGEVRDSDERLTNGGWTVVSEVHTTSKSKVANEKKRDDRTSTMELVPLTEDD